MYKPANDDTPDERKPVAGNEILKQRADLYNAVREFMASRKILEVDTPVLSIGGIPDPNIHSLTTDVRMPDGSIQQQYLQTSPEFAMKRLLAAGTGPIYQITRVFRNDEAGRLHNPEFSMLEWYRPGFDHRWLMSEIQDLLDWIGLAPAEAVTYSEVFSRNTGLDPHTCDTRKLQALATERGLGTSDVNRSELLDFLFNTIMQQNPEKTLLVFDYPVCQAALARIRKDEVSVAERFELFINGMEIANGFHELNDSEEQRRRFLLENKIRRGKKLPEVRLDEHFLRSLDALPDCSGVALGLDRLLMSLHGYNNIRDVLPFTPEQC